MFLVGWFDMDSLKIVIVGHIDHGKSTLIGRLLYDTNSIPESVFEEVKKVCEELGREFEFAYLLDSLEEEREQNVTIDTTQTFFKTEKRDYVIIDSPGHKEFLKNMITGASQADAALLIVDVKEGIREQTKRHAYILKLLGVKQLIIVINKMDSVGFNSDEFDGIKKELTGFLDKFGLSSDYIIPVSAMKGDNITNKSGSMPWYEGKTVLDALDNFKAGGKLVDKDFRMPVQDVYKIEDKRIIVGKIESGRIGNNEEIVFLPSKKETKLKSIEVWGKERAGAGAGESVGITITDELFVERGEIICSGNLPRVTEQIDANVYWISNNPIGVDEVLTFKSTTQKVDCKISRIIIKFNSSTIKKLKNDNSLKETEIGVVSIKTDKPIIAPNFIDNEVLGRFVLTKNDEILAAGVIL